MFETRFKSLAREALTFMTRSNFNLVEADRSLEERKVIEIGVPGADSPDPVLAHENSRVCIMNDIAGQVRQLCDDLFRYVSMA